MAEVGLVGRDRELAHFDRRLEAVQAGSGGVVLVEADAGTGKTALAHSVFHRARRAGIRTAWGACLEGEGAAAYRPWVQLLRTLGESEMMLLDPAGGERGNRYRVFEHVIEALGNNARESGLLLVIDDLHWADVPSMRLLQTLAEQCADIPLLVAGLYRGQEAYPYPEVADGLRAIGRERASTALKLGGLTAPEVSDLAARRLGRRPDDALLRVVLDRAEGNPLFILELLRLYEASGRAGPRLPNSIREIIGRRLERVSPAIRTTLRQAAVLGREFSTGTLAALVDQPPVRLAEMLDAGAAAELLVAMDPLRYQFAHVLTQEVLYAELSTAERQRAHARAARVLQAAGSPAGLLEAVAHHLRQAALTGVANEALQVTRAAAVRARNQLAYEHAAFQYREALGLLPLLPGGDALRAELLLELARCQFRSGAVEDAWRSCSAAADLGRAAGDPAVLADAATVLRGIIKAPITPQIHAMCAEALAMLAPDTDLVREAKLLAQLAATADPFAGVRESRWSQRALQLAEATGDLEARFFALQARQSDLVHAQHVLERLSIGERAIRLGEEAGRPDYTAWGHSCRLDAFAELGRRPQFDAELAGFTSVVGQLKEPIWMWRLCMVRASLALLEGRFDHATTLAAQAREIGARSGHAEAEFFQLVFSSTYALETGVDLEAMEEAVREYAAGVPGVRGWHANMLVCLGRLDEATALWDPLVAQLASFPRDAPEWILLATAGSLCVVFDDRATAALLYEALLPYADRLVIIGAHTPNHGPVALYLGMLATLVERWEAAESHLRSALAVCRTIGSPPFEARTHLAFARLLQRHRPDNPATDQHLDSAVRIASRLGMTPLLAEARAIRDTRRSKHVSALSLREDEIAALVAEGLSNRQIASRLHLSERTVENHVTHILTKLGFESRSRVAAWYAVRPRRG